ncbi:MAG TPA: hypothetical protein VL123_03055 [Candidatus Udaeobacter sp.]|jgi:tetratricopeptide (TPR) repeat protein|nr:hypothetical protein [Candidatus Udaeobacter sp.]
MTTRPRRAPRKAVAEAPADAQAERAARALGIALAVLAALRLVLGFSRGMWAWGLNVQRFLDAVIAWPLFTLLALSLVPSVARRLEPAASRLGGALARGSRPAVVTLALLVAALVAASPDNTRFVGDFLLRQGTVEEAGKPAVLFPQALPLDVLVHYTIPTALQNAHVLTANGTARLLGALNAALLAVFAASLIRALGLGGSAALAAWAVTVFGGYLGLFTGYSKSLADLVPLAVAVAAFGARLASRGGSAVPLGIVLGVSFALHRSALVFAIPAALAFALAARQEGAAFARRPSTWIGIALPLAALAAVAPKILSTLLHVDVAVHLAPAEARRAGILGSALTAPRLLDALNLVLLLSPLVIGAAAARLSAWGARSGRGGGATAVLLALALPLLLATPFIHPAQGLYRDWDDFAAMGAAVAVLTAAVIGGVLQSSRAYRWVAIPVVFSAMIPAIQWLALHTDVDLGLNRARAFVEEPPPRTGVERAGTWDFIGIRNYRLNRWTASADAFSHAVETAPSPRLLEQWAFAATMAGELRTAQDIYHRLIAKDPGNTSAWLGLAAVSSRIADADESFRAARHLLEIDPGNTGARQILDYLEKTYPKHP